MSPRPNPLDGFTIDPAAITYVGAGLQRPECILAERDGSLWSADARGGVVHIRPDGTQQLITQTASRGLPKPPTRRRASSPAPCRTASPSPAMATC